MPAPAWRLSLLLGGGLALVCGLWAGLWRMGVAVPPSPTPLMAHGPLMVSGFLGTVIALERAVALRRAWGFLAPVLCALGALGLAFSLPVLPAAWLLTAGSAGVVVILLRVFLSDHAAHHGVMTLGAACWLAGNALWARGATPDQVVCAWMAFLVLTIVGERLELNRLLPRTRWTRGCFALALSPLVLGVVLGAWELGFRLLGAGFVGLSLWLLVFDLARRNVRQRGLVRFIAACLLPGYVWLGIAGVLAIAFANPVAGPLYDALLHAVFVGFVFSMIFGHAPIIVPAVTGFRIDYRPRFYLHLVLLHLSLAVRVVGDLAGDLALRQVGGQLNAVAVGLFLVGTVASARRV